MSVPRTHVKVTLRAPELDPGEEPGYLWEWCHLGDLSSDEIGVTIDSSGRGLTFIPWTSVLRIDHTHPCECFRCTREAAS